MSPKMTRITVINDNLPGDGCGSEHGLCYLIETDIRFLFDTGPSDIILKNIRHCGIDPSGTETIVLSHGHYDHTGGLPFLPGRRLICHPAALEPKYRKRDGAWNGIPLSADDIREYFMVTESRVPLWLSPDVVFLGEIPRMNDFESKHTAFLTFSGADDFIPDDTGIAIKTDNGLVVVSGCAHSGIVNMVNHAIKVTGIETVAVVMGGFHLKEDDDVTRQTINCLKSLNVQQVYPTHCTAIPARGAFAKHWPLNEVRTGMVFNF